MLIAFIIFLPHILWEIIYKFPTIEFMQNRQLANSPLSPLGFFFDQIGEIGRASFIIWLFGLFYCFFDKTGKQYRLLGWMYVIIFCLMVISMAKAYYLAPVYPMLLASGSVIIERLTQQYRVKWLMPIYASLIIVIGVIDIPFAIPILPVETFLKYQEFLGAAPRQNQKEKMGILHQNFADMFGWEEMVAAVAKTFNSLTTT
jgi:hypothetical protein